MSIYSVVPISRSDAEDYIINIHYAHRWASTSYLFGLLRHSQLVGAIAYGTPPSSPLRIGLAGKDLAGHVLELNRLCLRDNLPNEASLLVSRSIKLLPRGKIIVSFADISQGHVGTVYKASNFMYCGLSAKRTDWKVRGKEHLHGQTIADEFRGQKNRAALMRQKYGDDFYLAPRSRKHRYVYVHGAKSWSKWVISQIKYKIVSYPVSNEENVCKK